MKRTLALMTMLVLTAALFVGCGCRNSRPAETTRPTTMPTVATTTPTTEMTTQPTTAATILPEPTLEDGNGPLPTDSMTEAGDNTRTIPGGVSTGSGITGSITRDKNEAH